MVCKSQNIDAAVGAEYTDLQLVAGPHRAARRSLREERIVRLLSAQSERLPTASSR